MIDAKLREGINVLPPAYRNTRREPIIGRSQRRPVNEDSTNADVVSCRLLALLSLDEPSGNLLSRRSRRYPAWSLP